MIQSANQPTQLEEPTQLEVNQVRSTFAWEGLDVVVERMIESDVEKNRQCLVHEPPCSQCMIVISTIATRRLSVGAIATNI